MRQVNGAYTQHVNRRHGLMGHMFQGRLNALLVTRDAYLQQVCRYVELNPVHTGTGAARSAPRPQWTAPMTVQDCLREFEPRGKALRAAYRRCGITMTQMAGELGLSASPVSRLIAAAERGNLAPEARR
jgi:hypothetical protein